MTCETHSVYSLPNTDSGKVNFKYIVTSHNHAQQMKRFLWHDVRITSYGRPDRDVMQIMRKKLLESFARTFYKKIPNERF